MADWGRRVDVVTWSFLGLTACFWAVSLGGVAALSRVYNGPNSSYQLSWWIIWFQAAALFVAALVQHQRWYSSRTMVMGLFCALTAVMMVQTNFANIQRQSTSANVALSQQNQALQNAQSSLPALPPQLAGTLSGIISGLNSGVSQAAAAQAASGGAGRKLLGTGRRLLMAAADIQRRADVVFVGFVFMTLLDLGLLVLFGIQHPNCKQRSPRVYISGVDQGAGQQKSGKEGNGGDRISLQVMAVPASRQGSGVSMHELRLPSSSSVTAHRLSFNGSPSKRPHPEREAPSRQSSATPLRDIMEEYPRRQVTIPPVQLERCDPCRAPTIPTYPNAMRES
ncbi:g11303 [Coccomyxa viridis]|uniref:G11303 protein n=1 Tax=Coccomyxa viridis TaxID=1274662 RepID=A0ABP1G7U1_9CHLO